MHVSCRLRQLHYTRRVASFVALKHLIDICCKAVQHNSRDFSFLHTRRYLYVQCQILWVLMQAALATPVGTVVEAARSSSGDSMILVAVLLCTLLRGVRMQENKIAAITLLTHAAKFCDDDTRLQRIVPYLLVSFVVGLLKWICDHDCTLFCYYVCVVTDGLDVSVICLLIVK